MVAIYAALYELTPLRLDPGDWWAWPLLFFLDDLAYYWFHRVSHESRFFWASHVVHHSSQHYNLSTALRQTWVPMTYLPFWLPLLLLGFPPWMVLLAQAGVSSTSSGSTPSGSGACRAGSRGSSTPRRTTASTTAPTSSTSTRTTAGS